MNDADGRMKDEMTSSRSAFAFIFRALLLSFFSLLIAGSARGQFTAPEQSGEPDLTGGSIVAVNFEGNHQLSSDELASITATNATGYLSRLMHFFSFKSLGATYQTLSFPLLQRDTQNINNYYRDRGFLNVRSSYRVSRNIEDEKAFSRYIRDQRLTKNASGASKMELPEIRDTVTFAISEGQPYYISRVTVEGLESLPTRFQQELSENSTIKTGQRWSRILAANEVQRLTTILIENGFPNVHLDTSIVEYSRSRHDVNVLLYFHPGHRFRYGPVHIYFDTTSAEKSRVSDKVILAQLYIDSGHWYQLSSVQRSELALYKLGTFDLARVSLDTSYINHVPDSLRDSLAVPVSIFLRMRQIGQTPVSIFGGESYSQGVVLGASLGVTDKNLFEAADNANLQLSWQPFPTTQLRYGANANILFPYVGFGRLPLILGLGYSLQIQDTVKLPNDSIIHAYHQTSTTAHAGTIVILSNTDNKTSISPDLQIAYVISTGDAQIIDSLPKYQVNLLPSISYQDDRTNDPINPTSGNFLSALVEVGIPSTWLFNKPSSNYWKISPGIKNYFDLSNNGTAVIATRFHFGVSWMFDLNNPQDDPSFDHRAYGGGGSSERGWGEQTLIVSQDPSRTADQGGYNDLEANIEFRYAPFQYAGEFTSWEKFTSPIRVVFFYDAGNVWDNIVQQSPSELSISQISQSIGIGLRYNLFIGALRVDCGFKLYDPSGLFSTSEYSITPASKGLWIFSRPSNTPLVSFGRTCNLSFGIGQAF